MHRFRSFQIIFDEVHVLLFLFISSFQPDFVYIFSYWHVKMLFNNNYFKMILDWQTIVLVNNCTY